jgi:LPXTG-motif cell wall-anchored protein
MSKKIRVLVVSAFALVFGLSFAGSAFAQLGGLPGMKTTGMGGLEAPAVGELGDTSHGPCAEKLIDVPAVGACKDRKGKIIMDLPALTLVGPSPRTLPATGVNVWDFAAMGAIALAGGTVLLRRVRMALAS